ncbi:MAG: hypothetical protein JWR40_232 [Massilia sp.]|nr:hypothetical protein [Massilia sp.]
MLSQAPARKLCGAVHAIGKRLSIDGTPFEVKAIIADLPANTSVRYDVLLGAGLHSWDPLPTRAGAEWFRAGAAAALGFASPQAALGQMFKATLRIVGVAPDLRYQMLRQAAGPMVYRIDAAQGVLTARVEGGAIATVRPQVEALLARHSPNDVPDIESAGAVFAHNYSDDLRLAQILTAASVVATALASFGIYVLSAYSVRRRSREIVLRKLYGAGGFDVGRLIAREFAGLTGIGALIGLPAAWFATERYLSGFVERAPLGWWPPLLALGCVGLVALAATGRHTLAAVRMSPALALRD